MQSLLAGVSPLSDEELDVQLNAMVCQVFNVMDEEDSDQEI